MDVEVERDKMEFKTPAGKTITSVREPKNGYWKIQFKEGGELPAELQGFFTTPAVVEKTIRVYLDIKKAAK
jgi:hypothetical protein